MSKPGISRPRLTAGTVILLAGFLSPLLIPLVTSTNWSNGVKTTVSGLLAFGIPEVGMLIAIAVMGESGYRYFKEKLSKIWRRLAPPDQVSLTRHRIGIIMFLGPILFGFAQPYLGYFIPLFESPGLYPYIVGDLVFFTSLWLLGGDFWDKLHGLFTYQGSDEHN